MHISKEVKDILKPFVFALTLIVSVFIFSSKDKKKVSPTLGLSDANTTNDAFVNSKEKLGIKTPELLLIESNTLRATYPPFTITSKVLGALMSGFDSDTSQEITEYIVQPNDSLFSIASKFHISIDTIVWANNIKKSIIHPGDKLTILPVSGVMHIVKEGDTVTKIAKTYHADDDKIISFNDLPTRGDVFKGEILIIPDGKGAGNYSSGFSGLSTNNYYGQSHAYPYGQCTWWVAQRRYIPSWGNASDWIINAKRNGYHICSGRSCSPQTGAVIYLKGDRVFGHVGYVEKAKGDKVLFSEMNYDWTKRMRYRTLPVNSPLIQGYIY